MNFDTTSEFDKDVKRLAKKWRSIPGDIEAVKRYIAPLYIQLVSDKTVEEYRQDTFASSFAAVIYKDDNVEVIKMRLDVQDLHTASKVRIVFVAKVQAGTVTFIELYAKNDKSREDTARIKKYTKL